MNFPSICRHKGADYRSLVYQRTVGNFKHCFHLLSNVNTIALLYTELEIGIFFCQHCDVRVKDPNKKTDYTESSVKCKSSDFINSMFFL